MYKFNKVLFFIVFIIIAMFQPACAADSTIPIRVGISNTNFQTYLFENIEFNNADCLDVMDSATGYTALIPENAKSLKVVSVDNLFRIYVDGELIARKCWFKKEGNSSRISRIYRANKKHKRYEQICNSKCSKS